MKVTRPVIEVESALTDRYQTTVPGAVRRALKLGRRDRIVYRVLNDATVVIDRKRKAEEDDLVIARFLEFLARDMEAHPERIRPVARRLVERARKLVKGVEFDPDEPLDPADE